MARAWLFLLMLLCWDAVTADDSTPSRLADLLGSEADAGFARALTPRTFTFPADHGPHPEFRNEWWYVTGNLDDASGRRFGFELTFFRFALAPALPASDSRWRTNQAYIAHLAVTDANGEQFHAAERYSRGAVGLAGAQAEPFRVWIDDWEIAEQASTEAWRLQANDDGFGIDVELTALRQPILNGIDGLSKKSIDHASYYYSITRLQTDGKLRIGDREFRVSGLSWLDREWSTSALAADQVGWDWFALQLADGSDLMFYQLRKTDGTPDAASAGTFVTSQGVASHLTNDDVEVVVVVEDRWTSPQGGTYPSRWTLRVPRFGLELTVAPVIANQELFTTVRYWEGAVDVAGEHEGMPVTGRGYVELTGYAQ